MLTEGLAGAKVFVRPGATGMRKQTNGLAVLVEEVLAADPFSHAVFLFCNHERRILKAIYWDRTGFALWMKRLEKHRFPWPATGEQARREISVQQLRQLLSGIDKRKTMKKSPAMDAHLCATRVTTAQGRSVRRRHVALLFGVRG